MKLSIIVPVYNTEKYIENCLNSILNQGLKSDEYEVLIINDGTPDNSQQIIDKFTNEFSNFKSLIKENGGLSSARNYGLNIANGEYIYFIDSDDFLEENTLSKMLKEAIVEDLDCLSFDYYKVINGQNIPVKSYSITENVVSPEDFFENTIVSNVWKYLFKKEVLDINNLKFTEGIYHEDEDFTTIYLSFCKRIKHYNIYGYHYVQRDESIMTTTDEKKKKKKLLDFIKISKNIENRASECNGKLYQGLIQKKEQILVSIFLRLKWDKMSKEVIQEIRERMISEKLYPLKIKEQSLKFKLMAFIINNPFLYNIFYSGK